MTVLLHEQCKKQYKKLRSAEQQKFKERRNLFLFNPFNVLLNNHPLHGKYKGYRSINITGDLRVIYKHISPEICIFITIDTHNNLYS